MDEVQREPANEGERLGCLDRAGPKTYGHPVIGRGVTQRSFKAGRRTWSRPCWSRPRWSRSSGRSFGAAVCLGLVLSGPGAAVGGALVVGAVVGGALVGCGPTVRVHSSFDERASFAKYVTFAMLEPDRAVPTDPDIDPFFMQRLRRMVREEMLRRGFREADPGEAQLRVGVMAVVRGRIIVYPSSLAYGYRWAYPWGGYDVRQYDEGTVVIDFIDAKRRAVVWRGTGTRVVTSRTSDEDMREVVWEILNEYPPGAHEE